jgi:hypothetical protein
MDGACIVIAGVVAVSAAGKRASRTDAVTIEQLMQDNWEVAGYVAAFENRSLILFKHQDRNTSAPPSVRIVSSFALNRVRSCPISRCKMTMATSPVPVTWHYRFGS